MGFVSFSFKCNVPRPPPEEMAPQQRSLVLVSTTK
jgi:hypothetical protein